MRNLVLTSIETVSLPNASNITATALDLDENATYAVSERVSADGEVEVEIWKISGDVDGVCLPFCCLSYIYINLGLGF
jgi:elongator complex protein 1